MEQVELVQFGKITGAVVAKDRVVSAQIEGLRNAIGFGVFKQVRPADPGAGRPDSRVHRIIGFAAVDHAAEIELGVVVQRHRGQPVVEIVGYRGFLRHGCLRSAHRCRETCHQQTGAAKP